MKRIATLFLAIVMLVSVMAPVSVFAADYTDPDDAFAVKKYTNADNTIVPSGETWIQLNINNSTSANGKSLACATETTDSTGMVSLKGTFKITGGSSSRTGLVPPIEITTDANLYTAGTKGIDGDVLTIYPAKAGLTGTYKIKWWFLAFATTNNMVGYSIKTSAMETPVTGELTPGLGSGKAQWVSLSNAAYTFTGSADEYIKIYNPSTSKGSVRMTTIAFEPSDDKSAEPQTVTTPSFATASDWTNTEGVYSTTANNNAATFTATDLVKSYYDVYYDLALTGNAATAPVVEFNINDADGNAVATHRYNTGDGTVAAGELYLGTYELSGAASVSAAKIAGTEALKASSVRFEPNIAAISKINPTRETAIYKSQPSIATDKNYVLDTSDGTAAGTIANPNYLNFLGEPAYVASQAGVYQAYCTRSYRSNNGTVSAGYYDVYWYAIVDADTKAADDVKAYVYHNGLASGPIDLNYGDKADGTKEWINLGTYYFEGGKVNEYISVGSDTAKLRFGGVKFVPNTTAGGDAQEIIVQVNNSEKVTAIPSIANWSPSTAVTLPVDGASHYYRAAPGSTLIFSAEDLTAGDWDVYYYHAPYYRSNYSWNGTTVNDSIDSEYVQFIVKHNGETDAQNYDNSEGASSAQTAAKAWTWKYMGTYDFAGEGDESVTLFQRDDRSNSVLRATAVKFVKSADPIDTFVVPIYKVAGLNYTVSANFDSSDDPVGIHEGLIPSLSVSSTARTATVTLPSISGTRAGKYKVSTLGVVRNGWSDSVSVTVADNNGLQDEKTVALTDGEWAPIGEYNFTGDSETEYVQFNFPVVDPTITTGLAAVKFEYVSEFDVELSGTVDVNLEYGYGFEEMSSIITRPYYPTVDGEVSTEQGTNEDGTLRYYTEQIPVIVSVTNGTDTALENAAAVYGAVYDKEGNLITAKKLSGGSASLKSGETSEHYGVFDRQWQPGDKLVTYVWDTELTPLSVTYPISTVVASE